MEVAKLTADVVVKIPFDQLQKFQKKLDKIADTLEIIIRDFKKMEKTTTRTLDKGTKKFKRLNGEVIRTKKNLKDVNREQAEQNKNNRALGRTAKWWGGIANVIARVRVAFGLLKFVLMGVIKLLSVPIGTGVGVLALGARVNKLTTEITVLSEAVGINVNTMKAMGLAAKSAGFTIEHVTSLVEELNNKMGGEEGGFVENNLREGFHTLGLEVEALQKLKPEQQLEKIMEAGRELSKDNKNLAKVASAYDKIFGQEGNRLLTSFNKEMNKNNQNWKQFLGSYGGFVNMTDDSIEGAKLFTGLWNKGLATIGRGLNNFFGGLGKMMEPAIEAFEDIFKDFFKDTGNLGKLIQRVIIKGIFLILETLIAARNWLQDNEKLVESIGDSLVSIFGKALKIAYNLGTNWAETLDTMVSMVDKALSLAEIISSIESLPTILKIAATVAGLIAIIGHLKTIGKMGGGSGGGILGGQSGGGQGFGISEFLLGGALGIGGWLKRGLGGLLKAGGRVLTVTLPAVLKTTAAAVAAKATAVIATFASTFFGTTYIGDKIFGTDNMGFLKDIWDEPVKNLKEITQGLGHWWLDITGQSGNFDEGGSMWNYLSGLNKGFLAGGGGAFAGTGASGSWDNRVVTTDSNNVNYVNNTYNLSGDEAVEAVTLDMAKLGRGLPQ